MQTGRSRDGITGEGMMDNIKYLVQKVLLSKWTPRILYTTLGVFVGLGVAYWYIEHTAQSSLLDLLKSMSPAAILLSVMLASRQFAYNTVWNKKDAANKALYASQKHISQYMTTLSKHYDVRERMRNKKTISIVDIHNMMGVFVQDGTNKDGKYVYRFVFNGDDVTDNDIKNTHIKHDTGYATSFDHSRDGREIERTLLALLNEYEYICLSTRKDIFDKETIIELIGPSIASAFIVFHDYIMHLRIDNRHGRGRYKTYIEIEKMYEVIRGYKKNTYRLPAIESVDFADVTSTRQYRVPFRLRD